MHPNRTQTPIQLFVHSCLLLVHYSTISIVHSMLAEKLNMTPEEAEKWIVNLIRNSPLDAKIDSKLVSLVVVLQCDTLSAISHTYM